MNNKDISDFINANEWFVFIYTNDDEFIIKAISGRDTEPTKEDLANLCESFKTDHEFSTEECKSMKVKVLNREEFRSFLFNPHEETVH